MATVNYDVWGAPETWVDQSGYYSIANIKKPETSRNTFYKLYNSGVLPFNTTDKSVAFWGIGKGSILANPQYISPYTIGGDIDVPAGVDIRPVKAEKTDTPCAFICSKTQKAFPRYISRYTPTRADAPNFNNYNSTIVTSFDYSKIVIIPFVYYVQDNYKNGSSTYWRWTVDQYFNTQTEYESRPRVIGFGYRVYVGEAGSRNDLGCGIIPYTWTDVQGYDVSYNNVYFYGQNGYSESNQIGTTENSDTYTFFRFDRDQNVSRNATVGTADTGFRFKYCKSESTEMTWYYFDPDSDLWSIQCNAQSGSTKYWNPYPYIAVNSENAATVKEYIYKQIAFLGLPFIKATSASDYNVALGEARFCLPKFDNDGITTGEYEEGTNALTLPNAQWTDGHESGYDPNKPPTPEIEDKGDIANIGAYTRRFGNHLKVWCLYQNQVDTITAAINNIYQSSADPVVQWQTDFQGVNPADYIVGFYAMLLTPPRTDSPFTFTLGAVDFDGDISAYKYNFNAANAGFFSFGTVDVTGYGNFLDYAPYTQLEVYIPLCGTVEVDTAYFMGHKMCIDMYYDIYTMSCVAAISRISSLGKTLYKTVNGTIGAQIPILSKNMGDYQSAIHALESAHRQNENRLITSMMTAGISAAVAIGSGGAAIPAIAGVGLGGMGMINTIEQQKQIEYQLDHTQPTIAQTGVAETQNSFCVGQLKAKLNIKRAYILPHDDSIYSSTVGNACCINTTVGAMSGLTICSDIICDNITNIYGDSPTLDEVNAIKQAFTNGVII